MSALDATEVWPKRKTYLRHEIEWALQCYALWPWCNNKGSLNLNAVAQYQEKAQIILKLSMAAWYPLCVIR